MSFMRNTTSNGLLPICDEDAPQLSNDVYNNTLRSECGVDAPAFLSAKQYGRLLPICDEDASQLSNDVYTNTLRSECGVDAPAFLSDEQYGRLLPICDEDAPQLSNDVYNKKYTREKVASRFAQSGRSMIEMLGVLAIVGVLSVGGIAGYTKAMLNFKTNSTIETMLTITANIRTFSLRMKDYTGIKAAAIKLKAIPEKALSADRSDLGENAFSGTIAIDAYVGKSFYVAMNGLPKDACISIATNDFGNSLIYAGGVDFETKNVGLNDDDKKNLKNANAKCGTNYCLKQQMTPPQAANACACTADTCSVALITF